MNMKNFRVRLCVRILFQNMTKRDKIGKRLELENLVFKAPYRILRNVGNSEVMPGSHEVRGSIPLSSTKQSK